MLVILNSSFQTQFSLISVLKFRLGFSLIFPKPLFIQKCPVLYFPLQDKGLNPVPTNHFENSSISARTGVHFQNIQCSYRYASFECRSHLSKPLSQKSSVARLGHPVFRNPVLVLVCISKTQCSYWCAFFQKPSARTGAFFEIQCSYWYI